MVQYTFYQPSPDLEKYIFSYGTIIVDHEINTPLLSPPNGLCGFLIRTRFINGKAEAINPEGESIAQQPFYVIGQTTFPIVGEVTGKIKYLVVFFNPLGMYQLFGCKMSQLTNKTTDLKDFLGSEIANELIDILVANDEIVEDQVTILNKFFLQKRLIKNDIELVSKALDLVHAAKGNISVNQIEESCQTSRRTLERHFLDKVGLSPKVYAQVFRFKSMMNYLQANPCTSWAELSNTNGYYDQAHLIRYFKEYPKVSPSNLVTLDIGFINYLLRY